MFSFRCNGPGFPSNILVKFVPSFTIVKGMTWGNQPKLTIKHCWGQYFEKPHFGWPERPNQVVPFRTQNKSVLLDLRLPVLVDGPKAKVGRDEALQSVPGALGQWREGPNPKRLSPGERDPIQPLKKVLKWVVRLFQNGTIGFDPQPHGAIGAGRLT